MPVKIWKGTDTKTDTSPEFYEITWTGLVLHLTEHNFYDDSDFYAVVWDDAKSEPREIWYATTRGWTYYNSATADATDEIRAKYTAYRAEQSAKYAAHLAEVDAMVPRKGRTVKVVKGRKVPIGTIGEVFWYGETRYGPRVGFITSGDEKFFTAASNVQVQTVEGTQNATENSQR